MVFKKAQIALAVALAVQQMMVQAAEQPIEDLQQAEVAVVTVSGTRSGAADYNRPTSTSATKLDAALRDVPQSVNVVPQQLLLD